MDGYIQIEDEMEKSWEFLIGRAQATMENPGLPIWDYYKTWSRQFHKPGDEPYGYVRPTDDEGLVIFQHYNEGGLPRALEGLSVKIEIEGEVPFTGTITMAVGDYRTDE